MKSKAHFKTHPLHPMLVVFPIAFFTGTLAFDLLAFSGNVRFLFVARCLTIAGLAGALLAAVPGILDAIYTVPPQSSAKQRVVKHALLNSCVVIVFVVSYVLRSQIDHAVTVLMELVAVCTMWFSGWLGGTLVHRNHISV